MNIEQIAIEVADELFLDKITVGYNSTEFLRRCLKKFAEQADMEPVAECGSMPGTDGFTIACFNANDYPIGTNLFTETQLLAAQQRTAEACAKLIMDNSHDYGRYEHSETIRNEEWREYL